MPSQFFDALVVIVFYEFFVLILVVQTHDTLEQRIREFQFTDFFHQHLTNIQQEFIIAVSYKLVGDNLFHFGTEFFFGLDNAFAKYLIENLLVQLTCHETGNFLYLEAEVGFHFGSSFFVYLQQRREFGCIAIPCCIRIEYEYIVYLCIGKDGFLVVVLHICRHHNGTFHLNTTFFGVAFCIQFGEQTLQHIVVGIGVYLFVLTVTLRISLHLVVNHFFGYIDRIVIYFIVCSNLSFEFRSQSNVEQEFKFFHCIEVDSFLLVFIRQRLAQNIHLIILDILIYRIRKELINLFSQYRLTIHFLHQAHRNHAFTETGDLSFLTEVLQ